MSQYNVINIPYTIIINLPNFNAGVKKGHKPDVEQNILEPCSVDLYNLKQVIYFEPGHFFCEIKKTLIL